MAEETKKNKTTKPNEKNGRGGKREGAGRKQGIKVGPYKENPKNTMLPFRVSEITARRIKQLRDITKGDEHPFVDMLELWVEDYAKTYGIE